MAENYTEILEMEAAKRLGIQRCPWMGDWFVAWSPRNDSQNGEGSWHHWANLAAMILAHPATSIVAPDLYRPDLKPDASLYSGGVVLDEEQIKNLFKTSDHD